jgi:hypothetical protein
LEEEEIPAQHRSDSRDTCNKKKKTCQGATCVTTFFFCYRYHNYSHSHSHYYCYM